jgi:phosphatidate cytidylyltransferase
LASKFHDLKIRTISAFCIVALLGVFLLGGEKVKMPFFMAIAVLLICEWRVLCSGTSWHRGGGIVAVAAVLLGVLTFFVNPCLLIWGGVVVLIVVATTLDYVFLRSKVKWLCAGDSIIFIFIICFIWISGMTAPYDHVLEWILIIAPSTDVGAYFVGRIIGGKRLAPRISPNKTWSGFFGGICASMVAAVLFCVIFVPEVFFGMTLLAAILTSVVVQCGDLAESHIKRALGVSDSGTMIPGHGGVIDRLDGIIAVSIVIAILFFTYGMIW